MTEILRNYNFIESEKKWQRMWQEQKIYAWNKEESRANTFVVDTPPPTVSGQLHIGHVYSYAQADFVVRFQRMIGKNIFYPIGFDDNGLPTERLVEKQKQVKANQIDRGQFIEICKEVVAIEEAKFRELFNQIALSVDWSLEYQTISPLSRKISQMSFLDLVNKDEVYRDKQPILWDPVDQTALAQADIEDKEKQSVMNDIIFKTEKGEELVIATTRPELLAACVAIFYHPDDPRYINLKGLKAITPLYGIKVPILADDMVQQDKGTGLVMCCTFGDLTDIHWWKKHKLATKIIINKLGVIDDGNEINGLKITQARARIIEILKEQNLLVKQVEITHTVKCAERSGEPLEIITTEQWFVHSIKHKEELLERAKELSWHPKSMKIRLDNWINSISWDWCISRQRYFGVPFPVWYSKKVGEEGKIIYASVQQLPVDPLKDLPSGYLRDEVEPDRDVMDTWATSAVSPQLCSQAISEEFAVDLERHRKLFPFDLRPQAHEIIRTWAFATILKAHLHENSLPWYNIMISGWCLAEDRSKMSKSKGNVIVPSNLLNQFGSDVVRYWASTSKLGTDTAYSEDVMKNGKRLVNKLWNAAKFVSQHFILINQEDKTLPLSKLTAKIHCKFDQWLLFKLLNLVQKVETEFLLYEYANAMDLIERFFWDDFCDNYLEITKIRAYNQDGSDNVGQYSSILTLYYSLEFILKLFAPFIPHITEEIYQSLYVPGKSIHIRGSWPNLQNIVSFSDNKEADIVINVLDLVRKAKAEKNLSIKAPINTIEIKGNEINADLIKDLKNVTSANEIKFVSEFSDQNSIYTGQNLSVNIIFSA